MVDNQKWAYNPISKFWYFLKADKDKFSTVNQSSGDYVFNLWLKYIKEDLNKLKYNVAYQCHDELLISLKKEDKNLVSRIVKDSMIKVNEELKLNIVISISVEFGINYAETH